MNNTYAKIANIIELAKTIVLFLNVLLLLYQYADISEKTSLNPCFVKLHFINLQRFIKYHFTKPALSDR